MSRGLTPHAGWIALFAVLALAFQGSRPLWEPDEGRYTNIAIQMLESGDWWLPRVHDEQPHLAKPPFTYWVLAASLALFGRNEWAVRLPYGLALLSTALLVRQIAAELRYRRPDVAAFVWIGSLGPFLGFNFATTDAFLAMFETAGIAAFLRSGALQAAKPRATWIRLMWLMFALGFVTKGPPALLPLLAILVWATLTRHLTVLRALRDPIDLAVFAVLAFGWFISMVAHDQRLFAYFIGFEFLGRVFTDVHNRNGSWFAMFRVYAPTLLVGSLPWLLVAVRRLNTTGGAPFVSHEQRQQRGFLWLWFGIPMVVFAVCRSRLPLYVLPLFVPICLLIAARIEAAEFPFTRHALVIAVVWSAILVGVRASIAHLATDRDARSGSQQVGQLLSLGGRPFDELVFVDGTPIYGLRFYSDLPVEQVRLGDTKHAPLFPPESVCEEARARENPLWLVPRWRIAQFGTNLRGCGFTARSLAHDVHDWSTFEVLEAGDQVAAAGAEPCTHDPVSEVHTTVDSRTRCDRGLVYASESSEVSVEPAVLGKQPR